MVLKKVVVVEMINTSAKPLGIVNPQSLVEIFTIDLGEMVLVMEHKFSFIYNSLIMMSNELVFLINIDVELIFKISRSFIFSETTVLTLLSE
jgi:hypothetical protein